MDNKILDDDFLIRNFNVEEYFNKYNSIITQEIYESVGGFLKKISEDKDRLYLFSLRGIGDFLIAGGLSYAVQKRKNKKSTVLVISDKKYDLRVLFPNVTGFIKLSGDDIPKFTAYFEWTANYEGDNYICASFQKHNDQYLWDENLNMLDRFKKDALKIPIDTPFVYPIIDEISAESAAEINEQYILDKERTIILLSYANSFKKTLNKEFWLKMAQRLKEKNYIVYTNVAGEEQPIEGTEPFKVSFNELYYVTDKVKCFIGLRSGVLDFLAMTDAKILNITPFPYWYWDISVMFPECNNRTFYDTTGYTDVINKILNEYDVSIDNINYAHEKIALENIFYSHDEILSAILSEVEKI